MSERRRRTIVDPSSPEQWQEAADAAEVCILLRSARMYGLVTGGPVVDEARCMEILDRAKQQRITPARGAVDREIRRLIAKHMR